MTAFRGRPRTMPFEDDLRRLVVRETDVWVTRDGRRVRPEDMQPDHQVNTLHLVLRRTQRYLQRLILAADRLGWTPEVIDDLIEESLNPAVVWEMAVHYYPVIEKIREDLENDNRFDDRWTPEAAYPWIPVAKWNGTGSLTPKYTQEEWAVIQLRGPDGASVA